MNNHETITTNTNEIELTFENNFDREAFIKHIVKKSESDGNERLYIFAVRFLERVIDYGIEHKNVSKNQLAYFLHEIIPDVEFAEIVAYCANDILTNNARHEKYNYWDSKEGGKV